MPKSKHEKKPAPSPGKAARPPPVPAWDDRDPFGLPPLLADDAPPAPTTQGDDIHG